MEEKVMALDNIIKKNWIEIQKKNTVPVNAIGIKINPKDEKTMKIWKEEGIDTFIKKWSKGRLDGGSPRLNTISGLLSPRNNTDYKSVILP